MQIAQRVSGIKFKDGSKAKGRGDIFDSFPSAATEVTLGELVDTF